MLCVKTFNSSLLPIPSLLKLDMKKFNPYDYYCDWLCENQEEKKHRSLLSQNFDFISKRVCICLASFEVDDSKFSFGALVFMSIFFVFISTDTKST